jgi:hypothetical protein
VQTNPKWPFWPAYIYPPTETTGRIRKLADKNHKKRYLVYYYGDENFDVAKPKQIVEFEVLHS